MGRVDEEFAAILGVPKRFPGTVEDDGIVLHNDGDKEGVFAHVVGDAKVGLQVVFAAELVAEFDPFDRKGLQTFWPIAQVAVDGDLFRRIGDAQGAVLTVRRARPDEDHCGEKCNKP